MSRKRTSPMVTSKRTWPTIMKSLDENAKASMAVRHNPSSKKVILTTNHVGPYIPAQNGNRLLEPTDC